MKRFFDLLVVAVLAPVWIPIIVLTGCAIALILGRPIFFTQERGGRGGRVFRIIKFRSMRDARDPTGRLLSDAERLGSFGRWLRATSLDELPELINILRGDMSLVGPRPLLAIYLTRYSARQARRHQVRPGLTGLAQVEGRNALSWEEKFEWDLRYVESASLWLDFQILVRTISTILFRRGISARGEATMPEFSPVAEPPPAPRTRSQSPSSSDGVSSS